MCLQGCCPAWRVTWHQPGLRSAGAGLSALSWRSAWLPQRAWPSTAASRLRRSFLGKTDWQRCARRSPGHVGGDAWDGVCLAGALHPSGRDRSHPWHGGFGRHLHLAVAAGSLGQPGTAAACAGVAQFRACHGGDRVERIDELPGERCRPESRLSVRRDTGGACELAERPPDGLALALPRCPARIGCLRSCVPETPGSATRCRWRRVE